jgi:hypothetical protein
MVFGSMDETAAGRQTRQHACAQGGRKDCKNARSCYPTQSIFTLAQLYKLVPYNVHNTNGLRQKSGSLESIL